MPGNAALGKLFFEKKWARKSAAHPPRDILAPACSRLLLVVGGIIRRKSRRRNERLFIALNENAPATPWHELVFFRIRCNNPGAAGGQPKNQSPVRGDTNYATADRTDMALRRVFGQILSPAGWSGSRGNRFLFAMRSRLTGSARLRCLGTFRG